MTYFRGCHCIPNNDLMYFVLIIIPIGIFEQECHIKRKYNALFQILILLQEVSFITRLVLEF